MREWGQPNFQILRSLYGSLDFTKRIQETLHPPFFLDKTSMPRATGMTFRQADEKPFARPARSSKTATGKG